MNVKWEFKLVDNILVIKSCYEHLIWSFFRPLGALNYLHIWHDNSGKGKFASWYLRNVVVRDVQTDQKYIFICNRWFAVEEDDGMVKLFSLIVKNKSLYSRRYPSTYSPLSFRFLCQLATSKQVISFIIYLFDCVLKREWKTFYKHRWL